MATSQPKDGPHSWIKPLSQSLESKKYTNCALCHKLLQVPIMLIENRGNACEVCYKKLQNPPKAIRNEVFEFVIKKLVMHCKFHSSGCKEELLYTKLQEHEKHCAFGSMRCVKPSCTWTGPVKNYISGHFDMCHKDSIVNSDDNGNFCLFLNLNEIINEIYCLKLGNSWRLLRLTQPTIVEGSCSGLRDNVNIALIEVKRRDYCLTFIGENNVKYEMAVKSSDKLINSEPSDVVVDRNVLRSLTTLPLIRLNVKAKQFDNSNVNVTIDKKIKDCLECPICMDLMRPPIYQCRTGHSICKECKKKVVECPSCKSLLQDTRNYALEALTKDLPYECKKCKAKFLGNLIENHENACGTKKNNKKKAKNKGNNATTQ